MSSIVEGSLIGVSSGSGVGVVTRDCLEGATCRAWVLEAIDDLERRHPGRDAFSLREIVDRVVSMGGPFTVATIKANIVSSMCIEARALRTVYSDLERVRRGHYRRIRLGV